LGSSAQNLSPPAGPAALAGWLAQNQLFPGLLQQQIFRERSSLERYEEIEGEVFLFDLAKVGWQARLWNSSRQVDDQLIGSGEGVGDISSSGQRFQNHLGSTEREENAQNIS